MKEYAIPLLLSIVSTLLNYIFISSITARSQQLTAQDFKTVLNYIRADILNEIKQGNSNIMAELEDAQTTLKEANKKFN